MSDLRPNQGKELLIEVEGRTYARFPIQTHVIKDEDELISLMDQYVIPHLAEGDMLFMSERVVAITQGRAIPMKDIHPGRLATFLTRFVHKSKYGIGLGIPETMQLAIQEVGAWRILLAAACAAVTKPFGIKGMFYHVAGRKAAAIDGPCSYTLPPYNEYATLSPSNPDKVAQMLAEHIQRPVVIIDANDLGVDVLGRSSTSIEKPFAEAVFRDNPLGQSSERTPLCIVRRT